MEQYNANYKTRIEKVFNKYYENEELLRDVYDVLKKKIKKRFVLSSSKGIIIGNRWIVKISKPNTKNELKKKKNKKKKEDLFLSKEQIIELCKFLNHYEDEKFVKKLNKNVFNSFFFWNKNMKYAKYISNIVHFNLGAHFFKIQSNKEEKKKSFKVLEDKFFKHKNTKKKQTLASNLFNRTLKYFIFVSTKNMNNLFRSELSRDYIANMKRNKYEEILKADKYMSDNKLFGYFCKNINKNGSLAFNIDEAIDVYIEFQNITELGKVNYIIFK